MSVRHDIKTMLCNALRSDRANSLKDLRDERNALEQAQAWNGGGLSEDERHRLITVRKQIATLVAQEIRIKRSTNK